MLLCVTLIKALYALPTHSTFFMSFCVLWRATVARNVKCSILDTARAPSRHKPEPINKAPKVGWLVDIRQRHQPVNQPSNHRFHSFIQTLNAATCLLCENAASKYVSLYGAHECVNVCMYVFVCSFIFGCCCSKSSSNECSVHSK